MFNLIIIAAAFVGVAALVGSVAVMFRGGGGSELDDRLDLLTSKQALSRKGVKSAEKSILNQPLDNGPGVLEEYLSKFLNLRRWLDQADLAISVPKFMVITGTLAGGGAAACVLLGAFFWITPLVAVSLAFVPLMFVWFKRKLRLGAFARQLPDALELVARALRAGHSLAAGFSLVASEMKDPIAREFGKVYEAQNLGIPLEESLDEMTERVPNLDLRFFSTAVILQRQTGGDLAEILDKIGELVRERFKIWGQIQALTGEGRLSGVVLLGLPPVLFIVMYRLNPDYVMVLFTDPLGKQMLAFGLVMQFIGAFVIRKIIDIKV